MKKFMAALLAFAAVILFAGCGGKTVDTDSTLQGESIADAQTNSDGQASKVISAYYLGIGLDKESRWKMTEEDKQSADGNGRLIKKDITDSDGYTVSDIFEYNDRGELIRATISQDESGMANLTEEYQYDENGVLTKKVSKNFRGMTEEYEYKNDEHGNPIEIRYTEKEHDEISYSSTETYSYEYGAKKIVAVGKTDRGGVKRTYEYQKSQNVITPESDIF